MAGEPSRLKQQHLCLTLRQEDMPSEEELWKAATSALQQKQSWILLRIGKIVVNVRIGLKQRRSNSSMLELEIVYIELPLKQRRRGWATTFFQRLTRAARRLDVSRGVFIENCMTVESQAWGDKLVGAGLACKVESPNRDVHFLSN
jgi:hypothetical protein